MDRHKEQSRRRSGTMRAHLYQQQTTPRKRHGWERDRVTKEGVWFEGTKDSNKKDHRLQVKPIFLFSLSFGPVTGPKTSEKVYHRNNTTTAYFASQLIGLRKLGAIFSPLWHKPPLKERAPHPESLSHPTGISLHCGPNNSTKWIKL